MIHAASATDIDYTRRRYRLRDKWSLLTPATEEALSFHPPESETFAFDPSTAEILSGEASPGEGIRATLLSDLQQLPAIVVTYTPRAAGAVTAPTETREQPNEQSATDSPVVKEITTSGVLRRAIARTLEGLLDQAREERFEDGMDSNLSVGLSVLFRNYPHDSPRMLEDRLKGRPVNPLILSEILHTLGRLREESTKDWRFATLLGFLRSHSANIRDAASVGLAYLDDKRAKPYLLEAIEREPSETFRDDLRAVVEQLGA